MIASLIARLYVALTTSATPISTWAPLIVDLGKPVPASIVVMVGQPVVFLNGRSGTVRTKATCPGSPLLVARPHRTIGGWAAYQAKRAGEAEVMVELREGQSFRIKVTVQSYVIRIRTCNSGSSTT